MKLLCTWAIALSLSIASQASEFKLMDGHKVREDYTLALPYTYISKEELPSDFNWDDVDGKSYLTHSLNQHIPQYCGSCWAHGALSALADRIKIARKAKGDDINLSIQYILNCAGDVAGSCHGGSHTGVYEFIKSHSGFVPYDTCMPYLACSSESTEGFCEHVDTTCTPMNTCRTCDTFNPKGKCREIAEIPNATIAEYGTYNLFTWDKVHKIKAEIYARGPVAAGINAEPILDYKGGIVTDNSLFHNLCNHVVSIVGWGTDKKSGMQYWIIRNSWGQYWGDLGYVKVEMGSDVLGIENEVAWATVKSFTTDNYKCAENGKNCASKSQAYEDPSKDIEAFRRRLTEGN